MALTKISRSLLDTGVSDSSDATAITIDSSENVGIGVTSPNAILTTDPESGNFNSTYNNYDGVGLLIRGNGTSGNGNYGPALVFGSCDSDAVNQDHKHSAISVVQTGTDPNETGLAFWTHPSATSTDALSESMRIDSTGNLKFNSGFGSVGTAYAVRAWVNFNGSGTVSIRESGNVSSITDHGVGQYTCNFSSAMPDGDYVICGSAGHTAETNQISVTQNRGATAPATSSCRISVTYANSYLIDVGQVTAAFIR